MPKYRCSANELNFYISKIVKAKTAEEASEKYIKMIDNGRVEVNATDLQDVKTEEV